MRPRLISLLVAVCCLSVSPAAWGFGLGGGQRNNAPVEVEADNGIEWRQDSKRFIARGNAKATKGQVTVRADSLTAHYREVDGESQIYRLDAEGNVVITSATETVKGESAIYDLDQAVVVVRGHPVRLTTPTDQVTADDSMEYWEKRRQAVARGNARAVRADKSIAADTLTAEFQDTGANGLVLERAQAWGNVVLKTPTETATGNRGVYKPQSGTATLSGAVKINRQDNYLHGEYAVVNLNSGVSQLFASAPGESRNGRRVQGAFTPEKDAPAPSEPAKAKMPSVESDTRP